MSFKITNNDLRDFAQDYHNRPAARALENAVTTNGVRAASFNWHSIADDTPVFSIDPVSYTHLTLPTKA